MARRRKLSSEEGVSLDSLMDALTNVVAVLILVLLLVQADVSQKVVQFLEGLMPATPEQVAKSEKELVKLEEKKEEQKELLLQKAPKPEEIESEKRQLALLEKNVKEKNELLVDLEELKKLEVKARKERDQEADQTKKIQDEISRLEALLDETPVLKVDPTVVSIPESRAIPKNAKIYYALVINGRVHFIDPYTPLELFENEFRKAKRNFPSQRIKRQGADRYIYDPGPIAKHFKDFDFKNSRGQKLKLVTYPTSTRPYIVVSPDLKEGGVTLDELKVKGNRFSKILDRLPGHSRSVVLFRVHPNSFNTYLEARRLTDKARVAAGWEVKPLGTYSIRVEDVEIKRLKDPPPPKGGDKPPALPPKLD